MILYNFFKLKNLCPRHKFPWFPNYIKFSHYPVFFGYDQSLIMTNLDYDQKKVGEP